MSSITRCVAFFAVVAGAAAAQSEIYFVGSRASLPLQTAPFGFPEQEGPLGREWGYFRNVEDRRLLVIPQHFSEPFALRQTNAAGQGGSWWGNFGPEQRVLFLDSPWAGATFVFVRASSGGTGGNERTTVSGFGTRIQTQEHGPFVAQIRAFDVTANAWSPWFSAPGASTRSANGSAVFMGVGSTARNIGAVQIRAIAEQNVAWGWFGINSPSVALAPSPPPGGPANAP